LSTEHNQEDTEASPKDGVTNSARLRGYNFDTDHPKNDTKYSTHKMSELRGHIKGFLQSYRFKQFWSNPKNLVEIVALIVLGLYTNYTRLTLKQLEMAERPWISVDSFRISPDNETRVVAWLVNTGKTPASVVVRTHFVTGDDHNFQTSAEKECGTARASIQSVIWIVMPSAKWPYSVIDLKDITAGDHTLVGCVAYRSDTSTEWHQTPFYVGITLSGEGKLTSTQPLPIGHIN
jgi:hypothetical protein